MPVFNQIVLVGGGFQDASGKPISNGWLEWKLSHDSNITILGSTAGSQVTSGVVVKIILDQNGNALPGQTLWPNDLLTPDGSYYRVKLYNCQGLEVWAVPQIFTLAGYTQGQQVNLGTLQPTEP